MSKSNNPQEKKKKENLGRQFKWLHFKSLFVFYEPQSQSGCMGSLTSLLHAIQLSLL